MSKKTQMILGNSLKKDLKKYLSNIAKNMAKEVQIKFELEYQYVIQRFYSEYNPIVYDRMGGLYNSYSKYYRNNWNRSFEGGISLSTTGIDVQYETQNRRIDAFESFLDGYHGHPSRGIWSSIQPYRHMIMYRNMLANNWQTELLPEAKTKARKNNYRVLTFK